MEPNQKKGRLTLLEQVVDGKNKKWKCRCDCGTVKTILDTSIRYGRTTSCGCRSREVKEKSLQAVFRRGA